MARRDVPVGLPDEERPPERSKVLGLAATDLLAAAQENQVIETIDRAVETVDSFGGRNDRSKNDRNDRGDRGRSGRGRNEHSGDDRRDNRRPARVEPPKPVVPITEAMQQGKEPLRSFSDLMQFMKKSKNDPEIVPETNSAPVVETKEVVEPKEMTPQNSDDTPSGPVA